MKHGGDPADGTSYGFQGRDWLDLSTGINPHAWPIPPALRGDAWTALPSRAETDALLAAARRAYGVPDEVASVAAPGTQALIQWLPRLLPPGPVAILGPTYAEHGAAWRLAGADVHAATGPGDVPPAARHVVLVNPNNPDGRLLDRDALSRLARRCGDAGGWLVADESFADLVPGASAVGLAAAAPVVVLRSFGKFFGLAGLRLGFALARPDMADRIAAALGPWPVASPALAVGAAALADAEWIAGTRVRLAADRARLDAVLAEAGLAEAGLAVVGGTDLFRLVRAPDATALHAALAGRGIWVRRFDWDPGLLRIGLPPDEGALRRLAEALRAIRHAQAHGTSTGSPRCSAR